MRGDLVIDGFSFAFATVGGMDATDAVLRLYRDLQRGDVNAILLSGAVISWYNVVDLPRVHEETGKPLLCVTYEESEGLEKYLKQFEDWEERIRVYRRNGEREKVFLRTGKEVYIRYFGMRKDEALGLLNKFTLSGRIPEPVRVARILARSLMRTLSDYLR